MCEKEKKQKELEYKEEAWGADHTVKHFPKALLKENQIFLVIENEELRKKIKSKYGIDVGFDLSIFEARISIEKNKDIDNILGNNLDEGIYERLKSSKYQWKLIMIEDFEKKETYTLDIESLQTLFLRGWDVVQVGKQDKLYRLEDAKDKSEQIEVCYQQTPFFWEQPYEFCQECVKKYQQIFYPQKPYKSIEVIPREDRRPRYSNYKKTKEGTKPDNLCPFIPESLLYYYKRVREDSTYINNHINVNKHSILGTIEYIICALKRIPSHAAIILHIIFQMLIQRLKGNNDVDILESFNYEKLAKEDQSNIPTNLRSILEDIAYRKIGLSDLSEEELLAISEWKKKSAKFRIAMRAVVTHRNIIYLEKVDFIKNSLIAIDNLKLVPEPVRTALKNKIKSNTSMQNIVYLISKVISKIGNQDSRQKLESLKQEVATFFNSISKKESERPQHIDITQGQELRFASTSEEQEEDECSQQRISLTNVSGRSLLVKEGEGDYKLTIWYKISVPDSILVMILPDKSYIMLDPDHLLQILPSGEEIELSVSKINNDGTGNIKFSKIALKENFLLENVQYQVEQVDSIKFD